MPRASTSTGYAAPVACNRSEAQSFFAPAATQSTRGHFAAALMPEPPFGMLPPNSVKIELFWTTFGLSGVAIGDVFPVICPSC